MKLELRFFATLQCYLPVNCGGNSCIIEISEGITIGDLLDQLKVPPDAPKLIFLNGVHVKRDEIIQDGDRLGVFPPVAGG